MGSDDVTQVCRLRGGGGVAETRLLYAQYLGIYIPTILRERFQFGGVGNGGRQATLQVQSFFAGRCVNHVNMLLFN